MAKRNRLVGARLPGLDAQVGHAPPLLDHHHVGIGILRQTGAQVVDVEIDRLRQALRFRLQKQIKQAGALQKAAGGTAVQGGRTGLPISFWSKGRMQVNASPVTSMRRFRKRANGMHSTSGAQSLDALQRVKISANFIVEPPRWLITGRPSVNM